MRQPRYPYFGRKTSIEAAECVRGVRRLTDGGRDGRYSEYVSHLVELFYSEHCLGCPEARQLLRRFASACPDVVVIERNINDATDYQLATDYHLIATPAFVIDRRNVMYGIPRLDKLLARIAASIPVLG